MWEQLHAADIERAKQVLRDRLADTTSKHAEEVAALQARHADELRQLEGKQKEIEQVDRLIDAFTDEFGPDAAQPVHALAEAETTTESLSDEKNGTALPQHSEINEITAAEDAQPVTSRTSFAETLAVRYMSPDFRPFRKFGT